MSGSRPGEENNGNASNRGPTTTAGLSIASKCQSTIPFKSGNSNLVASDTRDIDGREDFQCQPTKIDPIEPTPERPTGVRVGSQSFTSVYSSIVATSSLDIASGKSVLGPDGFSLVKDFRGGSMERLRQELARRRLALEIGPKTRCTSRSSRDVQSALPAVVPRQVNPEQVTTTIALTPIVQGATTAQTTSISPITFTLPQASSTPNSASSSTSDPLLFATGTSSIIYSVPTSTTTPSATASSKSSGLSVGAKAGIAVGAVLVVAAIACLLFILHIRRRRKWLNRDGDHPIESKKGPKNKPKKDNRNESTIEVGNLDQRSPPSQQNAPPLPPLQAALPPPFVRGSAPFKYPLARESPLSPNRNTMEGMQVALPAGFSRPYEESNASDTKLSIPTLNSSSQSDLKHRPDITRASSDNKNPFSTPDLTRNNSPPNGPSPDPFRDNSLATQFSHPEDIKIDYAQAAQDIIKSDPETGPHELGDTSEKYELDAGYTAETISRTVSPEGQGSLFSRVITPDLVSKSDSSIRRPTNLSVESPRSRIHEQPDRISEEKQALESASVATYVSPRELWIKNQAAEEERRAEPPRDRWTSNTISPVVEGRVSTDTYNTFGAREKDMRERERERDMRLVGQGHVSPQSARTNRSAMTGRTTRTEKSGKTDRSGGSFLDLD